jgi:ATP-dependent DNA ligase
MLVAVREQQLEGIVGKQKDSAYEPGKRSGAWIKHRVNLGQEFVIGGFTPGPHGLDAIKSLAGGICCASARPDQHSPRQSAFSSENADLMLAWGKTPVTINRDK